MNAPEWGPICADCDHYKLVHRGPKHDGACAALRCALEPDPKTPWMPRSRCSGFVARETAPDVPAPTPEVETADVPAYPTGDGCTLPHFTYSEHVAAYRPREHDEEIPF